MESRQDKYYTNEYQNIYPNQCPDNKTYDSNTTLTSRSNRNSKLYKEVYGRYGDLDNLPIEDNTDEIDIDRLKELVSSNIPKQKSPTLEYNLDVLEKRKRNIDESKIYDINKLLEKAKYENNKLKNIDDRQLDSRRDILETLESRELSVAEIKEACRKYEDKDEKNYQEQVEKDNQDDLAMTREMKYHTRQISVDPLIEQVVLEDNSLAMDLLSDLKPTCNTIVTKPIKDTSNSNNIENTKQLEKPFFKLKENTSDIDIIKDNKNIDTDFFTSSYEFSKKDFADDDEFFENSKTHNVLKILVLILAIIVFVGVIFYFILNYGIGT
jgi:hypothetical protein